MDNPDKTRKLKLILEYAQPLLLALLTYFVASRFAVIGVDAHHDGLMLKPALDVAGGKMLFRDTFTQYGALTTLLQAAALKTFGNSLLVIRLQTAAVYALISYLLWLIWRRFIPQWLATLCVGVFICMAPYLILRFFLAHSPNYGWWFQPWSSVYALFFQMLSLYLLILFLEGRGAIFLVAVGIAAALTMWSKQSVGAFLFCSIAFFLACLAYFEKFTRKQILRYVLFFLAGFIAINLLFIFWLVSNHAFGDMWLQSVKFVMDWAKKETAFCNTFSIFAGLMVGYNARVTLLHSYVWGVLPLVCIILLVWTFLRYARSRQLDTTQLCVFAAVLVSLGSWTQYYPIICERHLYWAAAPMFGLFAYFFWELFKNSGLAIRCAVTLLAMALLFRADITHRLRDGYKKLNEEYVTLSQPEILRGMKVPHHDALFFQTISADIDGYFKRYPNGGLINKSMDALYSAYAGNIPGPHPLYIYWPIYGVATLTALYPDYFEKLDSYARERRPIVISHKNPVIYDGYTITTFGRDMYVTVPGAPASAWFITGLWPIARTQIERADPPRDYKIELASGRKNTQTLRSVAVVAADFNGSVKGVWQPGRQTDNAVTLTYAATSSSATLMQLSRPLKIPPSGKIRVWLTGHEQLHYSTAMRITIVLEADNGESFYQSVAFLPLFDEYSGLMELCVSRTSAGDFHGTIAMAEAALHLRPDSAMAYSNICASWNNLGEWEKAVQAGQRAVELEPDNVLAKNNLEHARRRVAARR